MQATFEQILVAVALCAAIYFQSWPGVAGLLIIGALYALQVFLFKKKLDADAQLLKRISDLEENARNQSIAKAFR